MSGLIVQKYGGSSVATTDLIRNVARRLGRVRDSGTRVVGVVSAMGDTTDDLLAIAKRVTPDPGDRELALLLSTGEVVTATLMTMALKSEGYDAIALTGFQAGIRTNPVHTKAQILDIDPTRIHRELDAGAIPIIAGYQGWTEDQDIAVLGRGGSDTTAVAVAIALGADQCEILKDVDGI
ncbi:MAG: aspartate kinase, partial [Proteobacteria bacterium]|nr:aspartate kinase [Pseudomonadota bacterium]